jgi:hypothetical protein
MIEEKAMNKKCPYAFNTNNQEFDFCLTSYCIAWDEEKGGCLRLLNNNCKYAENKTASDINRAGIRGLERIW